MSPEVIDLLKRNATSSAIDDPGLGFVGESSIALLEQMKGDGLLVQDLLTFCANLCGAQKSLVFFAHERYVAWMFAEVEPPAPAAVQTPPTPPPSGPIAPPVKPGTPPAAPQQGKKP